MPSQMANLILRGGVPVNPWQFTPHKKSFDEKGDDITNPNIIGVYWYYIFNMPVWAAR